MYFGDSAASTYPSLIPDKQHSQSSVLALTNASLRVSGYRFIVNTSGLIRHLEVHYDRGRGDTRRIHGIMGVHGAPS